MAYKKIEALIQDENIEGKSKKPWEYSFEKECETNGYNGEEPLDRYFIYKSIFIAGKPNVFENSRDLAKTNKNMYGKIPDCDGSDGKCALAIDLYERLWNSKKGADTFFQMNDLTFGKSLFGGDTMNSVQNSLMSEFIKYLVHTCNEYKEKSIYDKDKPPVNPKSTKFCIELYSYKVFAKNDDLPEIDFISDLKKNFDGIEKYVDAYHTLGNFILVPKYFNGLRNSKTNDFWDSSLVWLKKDGFICLNALPKKSKNDNTLVVCAQCEKDEKKEIVTVSGERSLNDYLTNYDITTVYHFKKEYFTKYINYFFLWDYVKYFEHKNGIKEYIIKPLFPLHKHINEGSVLNHDSWCGLSDPNDPDSMETLKENACEFMKNATNLIIRRGIFMTAMLRLQAEIGDTEYGKLRDEVFAADTCYQSFEAVIEIILNRLKNNEITDTLNTLKAEQKWKTIIEQKLH